MSEKTQCRICSTWILVETAEDTNGRCMPCYKARYYYIKRPLEIASLVLFFTVMLISFPFLTAYQKISRKLRFPYDQKKIKEELAKIIHQKNHHWHYYNNFMDGYFDPNTYICSMRRSSPHMVAGVLDGRDLRLGVMDFEELLKFERIKKISTGQE